MMNIAEPTEAERTDLRMLRQQRFLRYFARWAAALRNWLADR